MVHSDWMEHVIWMSSSGKTVGLGQEIEGLGNGSLPATETLEETNGEIQVAVIMLMLEQHAVLDYIIYIIRIII